MGKTRKSDGIKCLVKEARDEVERCTHIFESNIEEIRALTAAVCDMKAASLVVTTSSAVGTARGVEDLCMLKAAIDETERCIRSCDKIRATLTTSHHRTSCDKCDVEKGERCYHCRCDDCQRMSMADWLLCFAFYGVVIGIPVGLLMLVRFIIWG